MNDSATAKKQDTPSRATVASLLKHAQVFNPNAPQSSGADPALQCMDQPDERHWPAFEQMFSASRQDFIRIAYRILRNKEDAEDAVQDALISAYVHVRTFQGRSALKTWFTRVVLNASLMIRRKRKSNRESAGETSETRMDAIPSPLANPEICYAAKEKLKLIDVLTAELNPRLSQAFRMTYVDEMPLRQAVTLLGVSVATFKARLFRARRRLRHQARRCIASPRAR